MRPPTHWRRCATGFAFFLPPFGDDGAADRTVSDDFSRLYQGAERRRGRRNNMKQLEGTVSQNWASRYPQPARPGGFDLRRRSTPIPQHRESDIFVE
jgi:hypothetical protein